MKIRKERWMLCSRTECNDLCIFDVGWWDHLKMLIWIQILKGHIVKNWKKRWFVLRYYTLSYFDNEEVCGDDFHLLTVVSLCASLHWVQYSSIEKCEIPSLTQRHHQRRFIHSERYKCPTWKTWDRLATWLKWTWVRSALPIIDCSALTHWSMMLVFCISSTTKSEENFLLQMRWWAWHKRVAISDTVSSGNKTIASEHALLHRKQHLMWLSTCITDTLRPVWCREYDSIHTNVQRPI